MIPDNPDELHILAGEYVLGTLEPAQRREVDAALAGNAELRHAVALWEQRLNPLAAAVPPADTPPELWDRIAARIDAAAPPAAAAPRGWNSVAFWRWSTAVATAIAASLALHPAGSPPAPASYLAVLHAPQGTAEPAFVATGGTNGLLLHAVAQESPPSDRGFELWAIPPGAKPRSLGLIPADGRVELGKLPLPLSSGMTLAISVEPKSGSPTGQPTGPVVFVGTLLAAN